MHVNRWRPFGRFAGGFIIIGSLVDRAGQGLAVHCRRNTIAGGTFPWARNRVLVK